MMLTVRVPEAGFHLLIARLVAESVKSEYLATVADTREPWLVRDDATIDGVLTTRLRPITDEEREELTDIANSYLIDAGVEPIAVGALLSLTLPDGVADMDELCEQLLAVIGDRPTEHPSQMAAALREILPQRYSV